MIKKHALTTKKSFTSVPIEIAIGFITLSLTSLFRLSYVPSLYGKSFYDYPLECVLFLGLLILTVLITHSALKPTIKVQNNSLSLENLFSPKHRYPWAGVLEIFSSKIFTTTHTVVVFKDKKKWLISNLSPDYLSFLSTIGERVEKRKLDKLTRELIENPLKEETRKKSIRLIRIWIVGIWLIIVVISLFSCLA